MKKVFRVMILALLVIILMFSICGCDNEAQADDSTNNVEDTETTQKVYLGFDYIGGSGDFDFYKERSTDVIYIYSYEQHGYGAGAAMTVMSDPETGLPLTYSKWVENYQNK